jgi:hypothetical protein
VTSSFTDVDTTPQPEQPDEGPPSGASTFTTLPPATSRSTRATGTPSSPNNIVVL